MSKGVMLVNEQINQFEEQPKNEMFRDLED